MIHLITFLVLASPLHAFPPHAFPQGETLKAHDIFFATEPRLKEVVGPRTSPPKEPGIRFAHPGYYEVWVDGAGSGMSTVRLGLGSLISWRAFVLQLGLNPSQGRVSPLSVPPSPMPLVRNKMSVTGLQGLPSSNGKPWKVTFEEYAVANHARLRALKSRIVSTPVGEARNALIRTCYDWWSQLIFTKS